jgi:hypothetical protein
VARGQLAAAETRHFVASLSPANEVPPVVGPDAAASGLGELTLYLVRDGGGNIITATADLGASVSGVGATAIILAHVHQGPPGINGPVRIDSGITPSDPVPVSAGDASFIRAARAVSPFEAGAILADPGGFYINVHSNLSPNGVARGQLEAVIEAVGVIAIPTLDLVGAASLAFLFALAGVLILARRLPYAA